MVGDRAYREIKFGNKLGCKTYWINKGKWADQLPNEETGQPDYVISSVEDLLELL